MGWVSTFCAVGSADNDCYSGIQHLHSRRWRDGHQRQYLTLASPKSVPRKTSYGPLAVAPWAPSYRVSG